MINIHIPYSLTASELGGREIYVFQFLMLLKAKS